MRLRRLYPNQEALFDEILRVSAGTGVHASAVTAIYCYALDSTLSNPDRQDHVWDEIRRTASAVDKMKPHSRDGAFDRASKVRVGWLQSVCRIYAASGSPLPIEERRFLGLLIPLLEPLTQTSGDHDLGSLVDAVREAVAAC